MGRRPFTVEPATVEELARRFPTQRAAARALGITADTFCKKLGAEPRLRQAWESGCLDREATETLQSLAAPAPEPAAPAPVRPEGTAAARVTEAIRRGSRTYGQLLGATRLPHAALVVEVQRLVARGRVVARETGGVRQHFLPDE